MKSKTYLFVGFVLHGLASIWYILSQIAAYNDGNSVSWADSEASSLFAYGAILATIALVFYSIDMLIALFNDFSLFSILKLFAIAAMTLCLSLLAISPTETTNKVFWYVSSAFLSFVQIRAFARNYD